MDDDKPDEKVRKSTTHPTWSLTSRRVPIVDMPTSMFVDIGEHEHDDDKLTPCEYCGHGVDYPDPRGAIQMEPGSEWVDRHIDNDTPGLKWVMVWHRDCFEEQFGIRGGLPEFQNAPVGGPDD